MQHNYMVIIPVHTPKYNININAYKSRPQGVNCNIQATHIKYNIINLISSFNLGKIRQLTIQGDILCVYIK